MAVINSLILSTILLFYTVLSAPDSFDWRLKGVVPPVRNQDQFGTVTDFAVLAAIESYHMSKTGRMVALSISELEDCCPATTSTYECVLRLHGLCSVAQYPARTGKCHNSTCRPAATISGYKSVTTGNETALKEAVLINPVTALIDASSESFQLYRGGIYKDNKCSAKKLDHGLLVVGYGSKDRNDYWICQNSWGTTWGENGYILIARNDKNMCGIATEAAYPI